MQWYETTLGEICDKVGGIIQTGPFGSQLHESDYSQEGTPVVMPKDLIEGRIATDSVARIAPEHVERLSRHKLNPGDIVYGRRGDIGRQALIRKEQSGWLCGTGCLRLSLGDTIIDPLFLHYYLRQQSVIGWISNQAIGATLPNLNTGILRSVPVRLPSLPVQRRIAGILSAYDELIENNQRRIKILEELARSLYREWFVHFRFPGHDKVKMVPSSLGPIPQGWEVKSLSYLMGIRGGSQPPKSEFVYEPQEGYVRLIQIRDYESDTHLTLVRESPKLRLCERTDIMIARYGASVARICCGLTGAYNVALAKVIPVMPNSQEFLRQFLSDDEFQKLLIGMSGRAAQNGFNKSDIAAVRIAVPSDGSLLERFERLTIPIRDSILTLREKIQNLRRTRDLLLPRLLLGQIDLKSEDAVA